MLNRDKDGTRAAELIGLLLDDATDSETGEMIRAWLWSNVSPDAKRAALTERFLEMSPNTAPDEYEYRVYGELAAQLNMTSAPRIQARKKRGDFLLRLSVRVAAALIISLGIPGIVYLWLRAENATVDGRVAGIIETAGESPRSLVLPDGSTVELAAHSELRYEQDFTLDRRVHLDGEALVKVVKQTGGDGGAIPFSVITDDLEIDVLGTVFRVSDPSRGDVVHSLVALYEGSVSVDAADADGAAVTLKAGEEYRYNNVTGESSIVPISAREMVGHGAKPPLWFEGSSLGNLVTALSANYGVEFVLPEDADLSKGKFSGDFRSEDLETTLKIVTKLNMTHSFTLEEGKVVVKRK